MLCKINHFVSYFGKFVLVGWLNSSRVSENNGIGAENNDSSTTTVTTFVAFIAKLQIDSLKVLELKQFLISSFLSFFLRQKSVHFCSIDYISLNVSLLKVSILNCVKIVQIQSFFWTVFSRIWTQYGEIRRIQSECGKIQTRKNSVFVHIFHPVLEYFIT